tara:strand:+ start:1430 stop:1558 length:129 start_codon:yes stop_codon:yes gene_type:complete
MFEKYDLIDRKRIGVRPKPTRILGKKSMDPNHHQLTKSAQRS